MEVGSLGFFSFSFDFKRKVGRFSTWMILWETPVFRDLKNDHLRSGRWNFCETETNVAPEKWMVGILVGLLVSFLGRPIFSGASGAMFVSFREGYFLRKSGGSLKLASLTALANATPPGENRRWWRLHPDGRRWPALLWSRKDDCSSW